MDMSVEIKFLKRVRVDSEKLTSSALLIQLDLFGHGRKLGIFGSIPCIAFAVN